MKIYAETKIMPIQYIAQAVLENGVTLLILPDGSADGSDGRKYYNVSEEINDDEITTVGWTPDATKAIVL